MKLIRESIEDYKVVVEEATDATKKNIFIEGIYLQSNITNRNNRIYPKEILSKEVDRYIRESVTPNRAVGELGHPATPAINLERISHKIVSLREDGDNWIGRAKLLDTPYGKIAKNLIEDGVVLGVSSRGLGGMTAIREEKTGRTINRIQENFRLATAADIVYDPSAPEAFVNGLMEGVEWIVDATGTWVSQYVEESRKTVDEGVRRKNSEAVAMQLFESFLNNLSRI